jgi:hypothetical protein
MKLTGNWRKAMRSQASWRGLLWLWCFGVGWSAPTSGWAQFNETDFLTATRRVEQLVEREAGTVKLRVAPQLDKKLRVWEDRRTNDSFREQPLVQVKYSLYRTAYRLGALAQQDSEYEPSVAALEERLERFHNKSTDLAGQVSNGIYRVTEMSGLWVASVGVDHDAVEQVMERLKYEDKNSPTVHRQMRNGTYRTVEMFLLLARQRGVSEEKIGPVLIRLRERDGKAKTIFEQIENGMERMGEMLELVQPPSPIEKKRSGQ